MDFKLQAPYKPAGGQPEAIKNLVEGFKNGNQKQTLLGITGSGKSLDYTEKITILNENGQLETHEIGEYVEAHLSKPKHQGNSQYQETSGHKILSFNPDTGILEKQPVTQVSKHKEDNVIVLTLDDGTEIKVTSDHSCYIFEDGEFKLTHTKDIKKGDALPLANTSLQPSKYTEYINLLDYSTRNLNVQQALKDNILTEEQLYSALKLQTPSPGNVIKRIKNGINVGIQPKTIHKLRTQGISKQNILKKSTVVTSGQNRIQPIIPITKQFMYICGIYLAEGHSRQEVFIISNQQKHIQKRIKTWCKKQGITCTQTNKNDLRCYSTVHSTFFSSFGSYANQKHIPDWIFNTEKKYFKAFLQGYFDGDAGVEKRSICATSASNELIGDLRKALLRFNITTRRTQKQINNTSYFTLRISGSDNLKAFSERIAFSINYKQKNLKEQIRQANTNVDTVPNSATFLRQLRILSNKTQYQVAHMAQCKQGHISFIENGKREPSQTLFKRIYTAIGQAYSLGKQLEHYNFRKVVDIREEKSHNGYVYDVAVHENETFAVGSAQVMVHNTYVASHIIEKLGKKTLVLAHNKTLAAQLYRELCEFFPENRVEYFVSFYDYYQPESYMPATDTYVEKDSSKNEEIDRMRLRATASLLSRDDVIVVASVSCIYGLGDPKNWTQLSLQLQEQEEMSRTEVISQLIDMQYERNDQQPLPGQFRVQGDTIEVIPSYQDDKIRIELFGDEIDRITIRHHVTGEELSREEQAVIFPAKHFVTPQEQQERAVQEIRKELEQQLPQLDELERQRLKQRTEYDIEMIEELGYCSGIENYSRHFDGRNPGEPPFTLLDFFGDDWLLIVDESHQSLPQVRGMYAGDKSRKDSLVEYGFRLPSAYDNRPLKWEEFEKRMPTTLFVSATPGEYEQEHSSHLQKLIIRPTGLLDPHITVKPIPGQIDDLIEECKETAKKNNKVLVTTLTKKMAEDLTNYLARHEVDVRYLHSDIDTIERTEIIRQLRAGDYDVLVGINLLREGLDIPEVELVAILDADKSGFLRDRRSLLQTIGRAARNENGRVVMYADSVTPNMQEAISITHRRREQQKKYNEEHGITPKTIQKAVPEAKTEVRDTKHIPDAKVEETIQQFREQMELAAENLEFEKAIELRDRIGKLKERLEEH